MIELDFKPTENLAHAATFTLNNMQPYYHRFDVNWQLDDIVKQTLDLTNWDIVYASNVIGVMRLSFDEQACWLRDIQIDPDFQNKGLGAKALDQAVALANASQAKEIKLKVFKISPALSLYQRHDFKTYQEDDRFYYMVRTLAA
ncbi:GNAT family N-acetyltransferase [Thalassotalea marina]|uniref:N-acetyltransferase domain-containing protein n=1 Tax=Thalassotalea marina TaxID=1673741 RepID=A0A919EMY2_9GAMM|nr:GNAT family N-acetyltransferase [Thalassotalea marina]GHF99943.1 hypothetical protein GCM10017161_30650 [Thalassotalea marina]